MKSVLIVVLLLFNIVSSARTMEGKVVRIVDEDSVVILDEDKVQHRVRFSGIDAPERKQPFGTRSTQNLGPLSSNKPICVSRKLISSEILIFSAIVAGMASFTAVACS